MPWYAWLILIVAIGSIVGGLMMLRDTAHKVELTDEQRKRVAERNAEMDAKEAQDRELQHRPKSFAAFGRFTAVTSGSGQRAAIEEPLAPQRH